MSEMQHMTSQLIPSDFDVNALDVVSEVLCPSRGALCSAGILFRASKSQEPAVMNVRSFSPLAPYLETTILFTLNTVFSLSLSPIFPLVCDLSPN